MTEFDSLGPIASDLVDIRKNWVHMLKTSKRTMAAETSVTDGLLNALKMPTLQPMPSYISEADTVSVEDFMQSRYA